MAVRGNPRERYDDWDFRESPDEDGPTPEGRGSWSRASAVKLGLKQENQGDQEKMANKKMKSESVKLVTCEGRLSFPALFEAKAAKAGDKAKYSATLLFRVKETPASKAAGEKVVDIEPLKALVRAVIEEKFGTDRTKWPQIGDGVGLLKLPFRDGMEPGKKDKAGYGEGIVYVAFGSPATNARPGIVYAHAGPDGKPAPLTVPSDIYGGCYARVTTNAYYWEYMGKTGVSLGLQNVQKIRDGEPFGGRGAAENDFEAIEQPAGVPAGAATATTAQAAPAGALGI